MRNFPLYVLIGAIVGLLMEGLFGLCHLENTKRCAVYCRDENGVLIPQGPR